VAIDLSNNNLKPALKIGRVDPPVYDSQHITKFSTGKRSRYYIGCYLTTPAAASFPELTEAEDAIVQHMRPGAKKKKGDARPQQPTGFLPSNINGLASLTSLDLRRNRLAGTSNDAL
jgi:hypothetical protein